MLSVKKPKDFTVDFEIVSCFFEYDDKILLLHRYPHKSQGDKWGVPAGKMEKHESQLQALRREILEETGQSIQRKPKFFKSVFVIHPEHSFIYHMYHLILDENTQIKTNQHEHQNYCWAKPTEALKMHLVDDLDTCIKMFYFRH